jgi:hypothetical protein
MCNTYNGWANWETWNMALWIGESNDESILSQANREIEDFTGETEMDITGATCSLAEWLQTYCEEVYLGHLNQDDLRGPVADAIYSSYLPKVEWHDIAKHYIQEALHEA